MDYLLPTDVVHIIKSTPYTFVTWDALSLTHYNSTKIQSSFLKWIIS